MRKSISTSSYWLNELKNSVNVITNMHLNTKKFLSESVGYFGSDRDHKLVSYEIMGINDFYFDNELSNRVIIGKEFISYTDTIFVKTNVKTIVIRACIMDEDMHTLPLWNDDHDYVYIILPYLPGTYKFLKNLAKHDKHIGIDSIHKNHWTTWEDSIVKFIKHFNDAEIGNNILLINTNISAFFNKNVWNIINGTKDYSIANTVLNLELFKAHNYRNINKYFENASMIGFCIDISEE